MLIDIICFQSQWSWFSHGHNGHHQTQRWISRKLLRCRRRSYCWTGQTCLQPHNLWPKGGCVMLLSHQLPLLIIQIVYSLHQISVTADGIIGPNLSFLNPVCHVLAVQKFAIKTSSPAIWLMLSNRNLPDSTQESSTTE